MEERDAATNFQYGGKTKVATTRQTLMMRKLMATATSEAESLRKRATQMRAISRSSWERAKTVERRLKRWMFPADGLSKLQLAQK